ncbi:MAG: PEP-CTERM sorting domain-containing protein [Pirellulales bacterium]|nr:PEP-CTERM sorting domain-containing protein [Pirellulales bacterium]
MTVNGAGSTWTNDGDLVVGSFGGEGLLEITGGGAVSSISGSIQPTGHVIADGAGSAWSNNGDLFVGGGGKLEITGGGAVSSISSFLWEDHATAAVDGVGSTWTNEFLGVLGGTLEITGGGEVSNTWAHIGNGSTARVTVAGAGSRWTNDNALLVGESNGDGTLEITGGGAVSSYLSHIGLTASSTGRVTINGPGSEWTNTSELFVGSSGEGALEITGGGTVNNQSASVAYSPNSVGVVTVDGAGSTWTNEGNLVVGERGHGSLEITGGGAVAVENELYISHFSGGAGSVQVDEDSRLNVGQRIHLHQGGTLQLTDGGVAVVGALPLTLLDNTLHVGIDGTLSGSGTILGDVLVDGGVVSPGFSPGKLDVVGNYLQGSFGSLDLEIGGLLPGQYDQLSVTGNLSLAGTVNIAFIDGFLPSVGDQFDFFQVGGTFDLSEATLQWNNAPAGFQYNSAFQDGLYSVHITAVPEPSSLVLALAGAALTAWTLRQRKQRTAV